LRIELLNFLSHNILQILPSSNFKINIMRKTLLLLLVILVSVITSRKASAQIFGCLNPNDPKLHSDYCTIALDPGQQYDCYDYVRAALEGGTNWVNRYSGLPGSTHPPSDFHNFNGEGIISSDIKYMSTDSIHYYDLVSYNDPQHVALKLSSTQANNSNKPFYASKWDWRGSLYIQVRSNIYLAPQADISTPPQFMVYIGAPSPSTSGTIQMVINQEVLFSINSVQDLTYSWNFSSNFFTVSHGSPSSNTVTLKAKCPSGTGWNPNQQVTLTVTSPAEVRSFTWQVNVNTTSCPPPPVDPCQGTYQINGTGTVYPLNTVNSVSGSPVIATLNGGTGVIYTWTLISGSPSSWYYYGTGNKTLSVALNKNSSASFRLTSSTCNRSITFSRGASLMASKSLNTLTDSINAALDTLFIPYDVANESVKTAPIDANVNNGVYVNQPRKTLVINDNITGERAYKIISIQGILKKNGKIYDGKTEIDIQDLPSGIYIITLADCSYRFIKQ
jgi:hypothetical protein